MLLQQKVPGRRQKQKALGCQKLVHQMQALFQSRMQRESPFREWSAEQVAVQVTDWYQHCWLMQRLLLQLTAVVCWK